MTEYIGGYEDWLRQTRPAIAVNKTGTGDKTKQIRKPGTHSSGTTKTLSHNERQELGELPAKFEQLELEQARLHSLMAETDFYQQDKAEIIKAQQKLAVLESELTVVFARWEELEEKT